MRFILVLFCSIIFLIKSNFHATLNPQGPQAPSFLVGSVVEFWPILVLLLMSYYGWEKNNPNFPYVFIENQ